MQKKKKIKISKKIKLSNAVRMTLIIVSLAIFTIGSGNLIQILMNKPAIIKESKEIYSYTEKFSQDTQVNLKENAFVKDRDSFEGQSYLSDLISNIDLNLKYQYKDSKTTKITYTYKIEAITKSTYSNTKNDYDILNKTELLTKSQEETANSDDFNINESIKIDYAKYHQEIKNFKQQMGINADSYLYIKFTVNTKAMVESKEVENEYTSDYRISLGDKIAVIEAKDKDERTNSITSDIIGISEQEKNYKAIALSLGLMFIALVIFVFVIRKTEKLNSIRNEYKLELNRILRSCEAKLVHIEDLKQIDIEKATKVKDIEQLLILSDEALVPIYCYIKEEPEEEAYFIVTKYEQNYIYILKKEN